jgi:hypothetical protein
MAGGLLNILSYGSSNILIYGNPKRNIFNMTYKTIQNFGMQRIRLDTEGTNHLNLTTESKHTFKIKRHGDLIGECFLVVNLPNVWSPVVKQVIDSTTYTDINSKNNSLKFNYRSDDGTYEKWVETGFKWIKELGTNIIKEISVEAGGHVLASYTGEYFSCIQHRDKANKIELWNEMTGNVKELYDPANAFNRNGYYPNVIGSSQGAIDIVPSIRGRKLYIPLDMWFTRNIGLSLPLIAIQYTEVNIHVTLRPINELFLLRDIDDYEHDFSYKKPDTSKSWSDLKYYLRKPSNDTGELTSENYADLPLSQLWNEDIHIISTYYFLDEELRNKIAKQSHSYLIDDLYIHDYQNIVNSNVVKVNSMGLVSSYMFRFRRSDAPFINDWSNYTNWLFENKPYDIEDIRGIKNDTSEEYCYCKHLNDGSGNILLLNENILKNMSIVLDGKNREDELDAGIYNYIEPYTKTLFNGKKGLYIYSFANKINSREYQPHGGMNFDKFTNIHFMLNTIDVPRNPNVNFDICDEEGNPIGSSKRNYEVYEYTFDMSIFEERYNVINIESGTIGMLFAR